jgi:HEAT repeat protein
MNAFRILFSVLLLLVWAGCATLPKNPAAVAALAVLSSEAGVHEKARACQELAVVGGAESVPALSQLLSHEVLADYARSGLETIVDPSAGEALRRALGTLQGRNLAGVVNSLGVRRELAAVPELQQLALDTKRGVAEEALASLGMIGTGKAAKTLQQVLQSGPEELRGPAAHASLVAAQRLARDGDVVAARELLDSAVRSLPDGHLRSVAQNQLAALKAGPGR